MVLSFIFPFQNEVDSSNQSFIYITDVMKKCAYLVPVFKKTKMAKNKMIKYNGILLHFNKYFIKMQ